MQTLVQLLPHTECGSHNTMIRHLIPPVLAVALVHVSKKPTIARIKAGYKVRREALTVEVNEYRTALSNIFSSH